MTEPANIQNAQLELNVKDPRPIVVGIDGSDPSKLAFKWAARQAKLTALPLVAISTWEWPTSYGAVVVWPTDFNPEEDAQHVLDDIINEVLGDDRPTGFTQKVVRGHPAPILVDRSRSSSLIVVGSRGHGEFAGMLLGSVSEFVATHALCPVVIVRADNNGNAN